MKNSSSEIQNFARCMSKHVKKIPDRAISFLYFYAVTNDSGRSLKEIISDFKNAGLGSPNITRLRTSISSDKRTTKISQKDEWRLKSDKIDEVEQNLQLKKCINKRSQKTKLLNSDYVDYKRIKELEKKKGKYDFSRLLQMLNELNHAYSAGNFISVIILVRSILDHIPPAFNVRTFSEVVNNYRSSKSFKESMLHLENSSRKIADSYLHIPIRNIESLPSKTQINFSNDLDTLLAEIIRIT